MASRRAIVMSVLAGLTLAFAFVGLSYLENHYSSHVRGTLSAHGGALGHFTLVPNYCSSGIGAGYFGVQLMRRDEKWHWYLAGTEYKRPIVRVMKDPARGPLVSVALPGKAKPVVIDGSHCRRFNVVVEHPPGRSASAHVIQGSLDLDCDTLSGSARFPGCY